MRFWVLVLLFHEAAARISSNRTYSYDNALNYTVAEPWYLLADIHAPNPDIASIHQTSLSFLRVTKDILSFTPRVPHGQESVITRNLNLLQDLSTDDMNSLLHDHGISVPKFSKVTCGPATLTYRTMDGSCNNLLNPCWGKAEEPYQRWLTPDYANGVDTPRRRSDGFLLPNPRLVYQYVSSDLQASKATQYHLFTNLVVVWGQFISHDMIMTPTVTVKAWDGQKFKDNRLKCCNVSSAHQDCLPVRIFHQDTYYPMGHCMEFARSAAYSHRPSSCFPPVLGHRRQQINQLSAFIDASVVYGSSERHMRQLREHDGRGARLLMEEHLGRSYPPRKFGNCKRHRTLCDTRCHHVGEGRANENPVLVSLHILFARHHNNLVDQLRHRGWDEETLFHMVRKIVGAQIQHITYNEYLDVILGRNLMKVMNLSVPTEHYVYNPSINPTVYNAFATAAFRYGHSMLTNNQRRKGRKASLTPALSQDLFSVDDFCDDIPSDPVSRLLGGQAEQKAQKVDCVFTKEITNHLFAKEPSGIGLDLFSINIQRGRDHGIPPYNRWREACGLKKAEDYKDLLSDMPFYVVERLEVIYGSGRIDDVDLYVAGIAELPVNDGILGPTFTCIVANQFRNLKFGDRFWYENKRHPGAFTHDQIKEIQKTTLSSIICANSEMQDIQEMVFVAKSEHNPKVSCGVINDKHALDLWMF